MTTETAGAAVPVRAKTEQEVLAAVERNREMDLTVFGGGVGVFSSGAGFNLAQRMASALAESTMVPKDYAGNPGNVLIAIDYASRLGQPLMAFMSHCDVIYGRPSLRGKLYIGIINASGKFSRLKFETRGEEDLGDGTPSMDYGRRAYATEIETGDVLYGPWVDWEMVTAEGWNKDKVKDGKTTKSKWNTMRDLMFYYRSAAFWGNTHAPDITLGLAVEGEVDDYIDGEFEVISGSTTTKTKPASRRGSAATRANEKLQAEMERDAAGAADDPGPGCSVDSPAAATAQDPPNTNFNVE